MFVRRQKHLALIRDFKTYSLALPPKGKPAMFRHAPPIAKMVRRRVLDPEGRRGLKGVIGPANYAGGQGVDLPVPSGPNANSELAV